MRTMHPQFDSTFEHFPNVPIELREGFWNYFAYGISPGSFGLAVLCNDFLGAAVRAHPSLPSATFRDMAKWLLHHAPRHSFGDKKTVEVWIQKTNQERQDIMIECKLRPSVIDILKGEAVA